MMATKAFSSSLRVAFEGCVSDPRRRTYLIGTDTVFRDMVVYMISTAPLKRPLLSKAGKMSTWL